jgi:hypothetical protein
MKEVSKISVDAAEPYAVELKQVYKGKDVGSTFRNIPMEEEQVVSQLNAELEFGGRLEGLREVPQASVAGTGATGILPIHIQVPIGGQVYRFAKTIVKTEDPLDFRVVYSRSWVSGLAKWIIALLIILVVFVILRRLTSGRRRGNEGSEAPAEA